MVLGLSASCRELSGFSLQEWLHQNACFHPDRKTAYYDKHQGPAIFLHDRMHEMAELSLLTYPYGRPEGKPEPRLRRLPQLRPEGRKKNKRMSLAGQGIRGDRGEPGATTVRGRARGAPRQVATEARDEPDARPCPRASSLSGWYY
jgi:hypothetical protein